MNEPMSGKHMRMISVTYPTILAPFVRPRKPPTGEKGGITTTTSVWEAFSCGEKVSLVPDFDKKAEYQDA